MNEKNAKIKVATHGTAAKSGNVALLVLAVLALLAFAAVVFFQYSEMNYYKDWSL